MLKTLIFLSMYLVATFADTCFTKDQIDGSNKLFTYKGKVYDTTGYKHPGGQNDIKKLVGNDLSDFVNSKLESFHLDSSRFYKQLDDMYVGELQNSCPSTTESPTTDTPTTDTSTTDTSTTDTSTTSSSTEFPTTSTTSSTTFSTSTEFPTTLTTSSTSVNTSSTEFPTTLTTEFPTTLTTELPVTITKDIIPIISSANRTASSVFIFTLLFIFKTIYDI